MVGMAGPVFHSVCTHVYFLREKGRRKGKGKRRNARVTPAASSSENPKGKRRGREKRKGEGGISEKKKNKTMFSCGAGVEYTMLSTLERGEKKRGKKEEDVAEPKNLSVELLGHAIAFPFSLEKKKKGVKKEVRKGAGSSRVFSILFFLSVGGKGEKKKGG